MRIHFIGDSMIENNTHNLKMYDRNLIELTGVNKIDNFSSEEFTIDSIMGLLNIKGHDLEIIKLNTEDGNVKIKGKINSIIYYDTKGKNKEDSLWMKLFKWWT